MYLKAGESDLKIIEVSLFFNLDVAYQPGLQAEQLLLTWKNKTSEHLERML